MPDSEPTHDNPRNARNLPVVVQEGEVMRPAADNWLVRAIKTLFGWKPGSVRDDLQVVLDASTPDDVGFSAVERTMLRNILSLHERRIADVMIHRADIVAVKRDIQLGELMSLFQSAAHSRLVVYNETLDDPEGMVHIRDLLAFMTARARVTDATKTRRKKPLPAGLDLRAIDLAMPLAEANITRKLLYVPPSMRAIDLLAQMQASRIHLALVVDEYGGTDGLVSIEDIVEQIVGEIDDEHDSAEPPSIVRQGDNTFIADARASLDDVRSVIGEDFVTGEAGEEVETLGGYLVSHVGRLPVRGEVISGPGNYEIHVLDADPRRVKRLRIGLRKERPAPRMQREARRREAAPEQAPSEANDNTAPPSSDGADPQ
ncbi:MAG TPA: hemolysin family protein [Bradyrhizobium sp.]|nr:hemolysin family protein [Bradyrhizobium sp.]